MNKLFWFGIITLGIILLSTSSVWGQAVKPFNATLEIPEVVVITGPKITLHELGTLEGGTAETLKVLQQINLGATPHPGEIRTLSKNYLNFILQQYKLPQILQLKMGEQVVIKAKAFCIRDQEIQKAIEAQLTPEKPHFIKKWVEVHNLPKETWLRQSNWNIEVYPIGKLPEVGTALFKVILTTGQEKKILNISGKIRAKALLYKAIHNISAQSELKLSDFELIETELVNGKEVVGEFPLQNRSTRLIKQNEIMHQDQIQPIPLVLKDHSVTVVVKSQNIEIKMTGIAKMDGWLGDDILLENPSSNRIFRGKVVESSLVEVRFK